MNRAVRSMGPIQKAEIDRAIEAALQLITDDCAGDSHAWEAKVEEIVQHGLRVEIRGIQYVMRLSNVSMDTSTRRLALS